MAVKIKGLPFLLLEVADVFVEDTMADTPDNEKCMEFVDYVLNNYIEETAQFYAAHPPLYIFVDVLLKQQCQLH